MKSRAGLASFASFASSVSLAAVAALAAPVTGCHFIHHLAGNDTVELDKATIQSMSVDIRKERKTICPRERVQMAIFADILPQGESKKISVESYTGHAEANKNDKIDFVDFAFHSDQGTVDKDGWFAASADLLATVDKPMEIKTVYKKQPDKWSFTTKYKPDYQCITGGGKDGTDGNSGSDGSSGHDGPSGAYGSDSRSGGDGGNGGTGNSGGDGGNGRAGAKLAAFATYVKTPFYDKLIAVKITGDAQDLLLAPTDKPITLRASGGDGGQGGNGGGGGRGGGGGAGNPGGNGGQGGQGGSGGRGGAGGQGGTIDLTFDGRYPELASLIKLDVSGGQAGAPGAKGEGGSPGMGGSGITPSGSSSSAQSGQSGNEGPDGSNGSAGQPGTNGQSSVHAGPVDDQFAGLDGLSRISAADASTSAPLPAPPVRANNPKKTKKSESH